MKRLGVMLFLMTSLLSLSSETFAQISLTVTYSQDFNTLADSGSSSVLPSGWFLSETGSAADSGYTAGTGSSSSGDTYSFGSSDSNSSDRALGSLRTGSLTSTFGANFINNTGDVITLLHISYTGEQWRTGVTNRNNADTLNFQYSLSAASLSDTGWVDVDQLDLLSPNISTTSGAKDGNSPENRRTVTYTITGLSIPAGAGFWIKWSDADIASSDDGLAIDDFQIDMTAPSVIFSMTPISLNFDTVNVGSSATLPVTVENPGTDPLIISGAVSSNPEFTFLPDLFPITITAGNSQVFNITFSPADEGTETETIEFTHNAPGSPASLSLTGIGRSLSQSSGGFLQFKTSVRNLPDGSTNNPDTIVLSGYSGQPLKALQFNVIIGKTNGSLILRSVSRGAAIPADQFNFSYEIYQGNILSDGSSKDTVKVVILGNGTNAIMPDTGSQEIMRFSYDIVSIAGTSAQTFNSLTGVTGATSAPVADAGITAGQDEVINIVNGTPEGLLGDINLDSHVNILDILLMIDYILGRTEIDSSQFFNGDIFPWVAGDPLPARDGKIDVLDLSLLQNIVLTGTYPGGGLFKSAVHFVSVIKNSSAKLTPGMSAKVTFYLTGDGITVGLETVESIKGIQAELKEVGSAIPGNTAVTSVFDQALYHQDNSFLRILSYDSQSLALKPGEYIIASIPFKLANPDEIVVENIIVADKNNNMMKNIEIEIRNEKPEIPVDYILSQNYPNPFNPSTQIRFSVPKDEFVTVKVYDIVGQEIATLFSDNVKAGEYTIEWNAKDYTGKPVSSGSYIYRMTAGEFIQSKKMIYIK